MQHRRVDEDRMVVGGGGGEVSESWRTDKSPCNTGRVDEDRMVVDESWRTDKSPCNTRGGVGGCS